MQTFKIGDWVISTKYTHIHPIKIKSMYSSNERKGDIGLKSNGTVLYASEVKLWQPKEDELNWFWREGCTPTVAPLLRINEDGTYVCEYSDGAGSLYVKEYTDCQLFIGNHPII